MLTRLKMAQAVPGMVVGKDVVDRHGRLLLQAGKVLSPKHLKIFKSWGIVELTVQVSESSAVSPALSDASPTGSPTGSPTDEREQRLVDRFRFCDRRHPVIAELFEIARQREKESEQ